MDKDSKCSFIISVEKKLTPKDKCRIFDTLYDNNLTVSAQKCGKNTKIILDNLPENVIEAIYRIVSKYNE